MENFKEVAKRTAVGMYAINGVFDKTNLNPPRIICFQGNARRAGKQTQFEK